jgi:hypothetical protein
MDEDYYYDASNYDWTSGPDDPVYENYPLDYRDYNDASNYDWTSGPDDPVYENYPLDYRDFWESGPDEDYALDYRDYTNNQSNNYADYTAPLDWTTGPDQLGQDVAGGNISSSYAEFVEEQKNNPTVTNFLSNAVGKLGDGASSFLKKYLYDPKTGKFNIAGIGTGMAALAALTGGDKPKSSAYQGEIPKLTAINQQIAYNDPNRRPGSMGRQYFTGNQFVAPGQAGATQAAAQAQAQGILAAYKPAEAVTNPYAGQFRMAYEKPDTGNVTTVSPASGVASVLPVPQASDTIEPMAGGGMAKSRYLKGITDGMADKIPSSIDGKQKAALSHGEFVIPADVVSHLGNGNSDAGAKKLYEMMSRIRKARTGNEKQGKRINPNQFMPGGQVGYAAGGIAKFNEGGSTGTTGAATTGVTTPAIPDQGKSVAEGLSSWAGPYVSDMLGKGAALSTQPYQTYTGPLTAGPSDLQQQQYAGLSDVAKTGYTPTESKGGIFDTSAAQQYMNPYLSAALDPQLAELRRQGQITNLGNRAQATKMGAFGGSGSALMETETQRNVLDKMQQALGQGYNTAYDKAMAQYNADQNRQLEAGRDTEASRQYSANFGLKTLGELGAAGATQRDIEQRGIAADKAQFEEQRDFPYKQVQFQKSLLTGLPITTTDTTQMQSQLGQISGQIAGLASLYQLLAGLGQTK